MSFMSPNMPTAPDIGPPVPPPPPPTPERVGAEAARQEEKRRLLRRKGRSSTILTGKETLGAVPGERKTLLGQ